MARLLVWVPDEETLTPGVGHVAKGNRRVPFGRYLHSNPTKALQAYGVGDVIAVKPDGFEFGKEEVADTATRDCPFAIVDVPGVDVSDFAHLMRPDMREGPTLDHGDPQKAVVRKRRWRLNLSQADQDELRAGSKSARWNRNKVRGKEQDKGP